MIEQISNSVTGTASLPPIIGLGSALGATNLSVLATNAFASPNSGYPSGFSLGVAASNNASGHFSLVSGLTVAGSAVSIAQQQISDIQDIVSGLQSRFDALANTRYSADQQTAQREQLNNDLQSIASKIQGAAVGNFNLLDASQSSGVRINLQSGELSNIGTTPSQAISGVDKNFSYNSQSLTFQTIDLTSAFASLSVTGTNSVVSISGFQNALNQASDNLNNFKNQLTQTAIQATGDVTANTDANAVTTTISSGTAAQQIASRLAQQLYNDSVNISTNPTFKYFSLFS